MKYGYDSYGWYNGITDADRSTTTAPPTCSGGQQANWTGNAWVCVVYSAPVPVPPLIPIWAWYIDIGALFDRFGAAKLAVLTSTEPIVKAFVTDMQSRHWGDLQNPQLAAGIEYMRGVTVPGIGTIGTPIAGITAALETAILTTSVALAENLATRKLFFS